MSTKKKSTHLKDFSASELDALAADYDQIRREIDRLSSDGLTTVRLPRVANNREQLEELVKFEASGDLWIRISYANNLNVGVKQAPDIEPDSSDTYLAVLHRRDR